MVKKPTSSEISTKSWDLTEEDAWIELRDPKSLRVFWWNSLSDATRVPEREAEAEEETTQAASRAWKFSTDGRRVVETASEVEMPPERLKEKKGSDGLVENGDGETRSGSDEEKLGSLKISAINEKFSIAMPVGEVEGIEPGNIVRMQ